MRWNLKEAGCEEHTNSRANLWSNEQKPHEVMHEGKTATLPKHTKHLTWIDGQMDGEEERGTQGDLVDASPDNTLEAYLQLFKEYKRLKKRGIFLVF